MLKLCALASFLLLLAFINNKPIIMKTKIYKMFGNSLLLSVLCSLFSIFCFSQDYEWDWAKHGGGSNQYGAEQPLYLSNFSAEMIWDIAIDEDNNYYFLASLSSGDTHVDGNAITDYAASFNGAKNTVIF